MITAEEQTSKLATEQTVMVLDVRSPEAFANSTTTVKGSYHYKLRKFRYRLQYPPFKDLPRNTEIVTYCACPNDEASIAAAQLLQESGFKQVKVWHVIMRLTVVKIRYCKSQSLVLHKR